MEVTLSSKSVLNLILNVFLFLSSCAGPNLAWACDGRFLQEPTTRDPDSTQEDTVAGLVYWSYKFLDGRVLTTVRQLLEVTTNESVLVTMHPLFYIITEPGHESITYIDKEGHGHCYEIERY